MGAELGATSSIFPSDEITRAFLVAQKRGEKWMELKADDNASYDELIEIDLSSLEPMAACPHSPDRVEKISALKGKKVDQALIGSCTNSSLKDMLTVAAVLKGKTVHPDVSLGIAPGSKQVLSMLAETGALTDIIAAGTRILESACGPCIGMGQSPRTKGVSLRTFNRNFKGRSGTEDAEIYLVSPEVAAASAIAGVLTDPRELGSYPEIKIPADFSVDDSMIIPPPADRNIEITRGPNIKPFPKRGAMEDSVELEVLLKLEDNITTDDIMPAGSKILPLRSNIEKISKYVFSGIDSNFSERAIAAGAGCVLARNNYGQGSSREHAAIAPMYLGIKAVLAITFARIHRANLINFGILPVTIDESSYHSIRSGDKIQISGILGALDGTGRIKIENTSSGNSIAGKLTVSEREAALLKKGGLLNYIKSVAGD